MMIDDYLSVCCSAPPNYMFSISGDESIGITGICSGCGEHIEFIDNDNNEE